MWKGKYAVPCKQSAAMITHDESNLSIMLVRDAEMRKLLHYVATGIQKITQSWFLPLKSFVIKNRSTLQRLNSKMMTGMTWKKEWLQPLLSLLLYYIWSAKMSPIFVRASIHPSDGLQTTPRIVWFFKKNSCPVSESFSKMGPDIKPSNRRNDWTLDAVYHW